VCSVVVSIDSMFSRSMTDTVSTHIILLIDEWVICVSVCLCVCICGRVHFNGETRSTIGIKLSLKSDFAFLWR
jgi:hypothetical protein